jgi:hypothetical protein
LASGVVVTVGEEPSRGFGEHSNTSAQEDGEEDLKSNREPPLHCAERSDRKEGVNKRSETAERVCGREGQKGDERRLLP